MEKKATIEKTEAITIAPLDMRVLTCKLRGTAPFLQLRFSEKAMNAMRAKQEEGSRANSKKPKRDARNFDNDFHGAYYQFADGNYGFPAAAIRNAMISACRVAGYQMTRAKLSVFALSDGLDKTDSTPLVRLDSAPVPHVAAVRNQTGVADIRVRAIWPEWSATVRVRFDAGQLSEVDVLNLLVRAGAQVGIGEGRPDSRESAGLGFGLFDVESVDKFEKSVA